MDKLDNMNHFTYIQPLGNGKHLLQDDYILAQMPTQVCLKIAEESENGFKLKELVLKIIDTYPRFLRKK